MTPARALVLEIDRTQSATLAEIEVDAFLDPWPVEALRDLLGDGHTRAFVAARGADAIGAALVRVVAGEGELLRIGVRPAARRQGIGRLLLQRVLAIVAAACPHGVHLEVRESNHAARRLYAATGFVESGRRRGYYRGPDEDAILMHWQPPNHS